MVWAGKDPGVYPVQSPGPDRDIFHHPNHTLRAFIPHKLNGPKSPHSMEWLFQGLEFPAVASPCSNAFGRGQCIVQAATSHGNRIFLPTFPALHRGRNQGSARGPQVRAHPNCSEPSRNSSRHPSSRHSSCWEDLALLQGPESSSHKQTPEERREQTEEGRRRRGKKKKSQQVDLDFHQGFHPPPFNEHRRTGVWNSLPAHEPRRRESQQPGSAALPPSQAAAAAANLQPFSPSAFPFPGAAARA